MKVALVTSCFVPHDGVGNTIREKLEAFASWGWATDVYHQQSQWDIPRGHSTRYLELADVIEERAFGRPGNFFDHDLFIVHYLIHYPLMEVCRLVDRGKLIVEYPGITPAHFYPLGDPFRNFTADALKHLDLLDYADAVVVHSNSMKRELLSLHPMEEERVRVLPLAVTPAFTPGNDDEGRPTLIYVGRLTANKRLDVLVSALAHLKEEFGDLRLLLVGEHRRGASTAYRNDLTSLARRLGVESRLRFVSNVDEAALVDLYRKASLFVTASLHEGFCLPVAEAMACGLPCVVPRMTALPETLRSGGVTCAPDDPADMAAAIRRLLVDPRRREELSRRALEESTRYRRSSFRDRLGKLIEEVQALPPRRSVRERGSLRLVDAATSLEVRYADRIRHPLVGGLVSWFRRKVTLPLEKSCVRTMARQQTLWNQLMLRELRRLQAEVEELRKRLPRQREDQ